MTHFSILVVLFPIFWLSFSDSITVISFKFPSLFPSSREQIQINPNQTKPKWTRVSWVVSRCVIPYKGPISQYWRGYSNIFSDCINNFQILLVFSSFTDQVLAFGLLELCPFRWENWESWNYSRMNFPFPNIVAVILIFWYFFSDAMNNFQRLLVFSSSRDQILAVWLVLGCANTVGGVLGSWKRVYRMKAVWITSRCSSFWVG